MRTILYTSPIGRLFVAERDDAITGLWMEGQKYFPDYLPEPGQASPVLEQAALWLDRYFGGAQPEISELPLAPEGTSFRQQIWTLLCQIPYGQTVTYGALARKAAAIQNRKSMSAQAVGSAVGHNPISIIIPCHRVIGADGSLTGYAGGLERKRWLLELEGHTTHK